MEILIFAHHEQARQYCSAVARQKRGERCKTSVYRDIVWCFPERLSFPENGLRNLPTEDTAKKLARRVRAKSEIFMKRGKLPVWVPGDATGDATGDAANWMAEWAH